jgi:ABC-2 type transport system ATP-binding protein
MLNVVNLKKQYDSVLAVDNVSLNVGPGQILGLLGPNGAGKTTTIRMILDIIQPDSGSITYDGHPFNDGVRNLVGYLPEERGLYRKSRVTPTLLYFASLKGIRADEGKRRIYEWLKRFDLLNYHDHKIEELSKGNQQKIQFIISILHDPQLVILDEPYSGLDPVNQILLTEILGELKQKGKAIIFSTHQMDHAEKLCDTICLIARGKVILEGRVDEIKRRFGKNSIQMIYSGDGSFLRNLPTIKAAYIYENYAELILHNEDQGSKVLAEIAPRLNVRKYENVEPSLNAIFLELVGGGDKGLDGSGKSPR